MNLQVAICLVLASCTSWNGASAKLQSRIIRGQDARIESYPYQVSLRAQGVHFCGGSIISEKHILTAAHCIDERMVPPFTYTRVHTGTSDSHAQGHAHRIAGVKTHPAYVPGGGYHNDLAVVTLLDPIKFDSSQRKIPMASKDSQEGERAVVTGWGTTSPSQHIEPRALQKANAIIMTSNTCRSHLQHVGQIYNEHVCAKVVPAGGVCTGDSGGPLAVNGQLVGVVSWVDEPCGKGKPDVYTKVFAYRSFIDSAMKSPPDQTPQGLPQDFPQGLPQDFPQGLPLDFPQGLPQEFPQFGQPQLPSDGYDLDQLLQQYPTLQQWYPQIPQFQYPGLYPGLEGDVYTR